MKNLAIIIFTLFVCAGCLPQSSNPTDSQEQANTAPQLSNQDDISATTLMAAVQLGVPLKCTYKVDGMETQAWVQGKKFRGKTLQDDLVVEIIMKDNCMWSWGNEEGKGIKTCYEPEEANDTLWGEPASEPAESPDQPISTPEVEYSCRPAMIGDDQFTPPTDIEFTDINDMMQQMMPDPDQLPDSVKQQMQSFGM